MSKVTGFKNTQKIKEEAAMWLLKIEDESPLPQQDVEALRAWVETSEVHREVIIRMSKTWSDMDVLSAMMMPSIPQKFSPWKLFRAWLISPIILLFCLMDKLIQALLITTIPQRTLACSLILVAFGAWFVSQPEVSSSNIYQTGVGEQAHHVLYDGSELSLNTNSQVEVLYSDEFRRIRLVKGEAHFAVKKDTHRPFEVYSNDRLVRAIGTSFSVYRLEEKIEVFVSEGTVELAIVDETLVLKPDDHPAFDNKQAESKVQTLSDKNIEDINNGVDMYLGKLEAGQSVSIPSGAASLSIKSYEDSVITHNAGELIRKLSWLDGNLVFAGESLEQVVTEISRHTRMRIDVPDPTLREMRIGGHFQAGDTDALFFVLESGFGIHVNRLSENHVELQVKGTSD